MKWTDDTITNNTFLFKNLEIGGVFDKDDILYIKTSANSAFDIIHNNWTIFHDDTVVLPPLS